MTNREKQILRLLEENPLLQQEEIATLLNISRSAIAGHIANLMQKGVIQGKGYILSKPHYVSVVGGIDMDIFGYAIKPLSYGDSNPGRVTRSPGGVGRNIAQNIALLGKDCHLLSVVGDDFDGDLLLGDAKKNNVNVDRCAILANETTATYFSLIDENGEMIVAVNDMSIFAKLTPTLLSKNRLHLERSEAIVVDCNLSEETLAWLFGHCAKTAIFVDTVSAFKAPKIIPWLSCIHTLKTNLLEAETLSGITVEKDASNVAELANWFHSKGLFRVVISMGSKGVFYSEKKGITGKALPYKVNVVNVTGAGDALMAGLVSCYLDRFSFPDSVNFAQACAALTLESECTNNPNLSSQSVKKLMELTHE